MILRKSLLDLRLRPSHHGRNGAPRPAAHQAGMNPPFIATGLDCGHLGISDDHQNFLNTLAPVNGATMAVNIPFLVISGPAKPPRQQHELGHLITKEREFHLQRMTQKRRFASLVERD